jgi:hypothetical protein
MIIDAVRRCYPDKPISASIALATAAEQETKATRVTSTAPFQSPTLHMKKGHPSDEF